MIGKDKKRANITLHKATWAGIAKIAGIRNLTESQVIEVAFLLAKTKLEEIPASGYQITLREHYKVNNWVKED